MTPGERKPCVLREPDELGTDRWDPRPRALTGHCGPGAMFPCACPVGNEPGVLADSILPYSNMLCREKCMFSA